MSDEFDLLGDPAGATPPAKRPTAALVAGLVAVVLLALVGVVWMVSSVAARGGKVDTAAATPAATTTAPPATDPATTQPPATTPAAATSTVPVPTATLTVPAGPVPTAVTVAPVPTAPRPIPTRTITLPAPKPTVSAPGGKLVTVPGVIGLRVKAASDVLRTAGLKVQVLGGIATPDRDDRRVTAQRPGPGSIVRAGATVILVTDGI
ncbi:MAG TPA: PASTA domain-containing protein [Mycobacteriales bacterium]|nr:PASTA domain-containing protein [Mycobacteriales bacterium]